MKKKFFLKDNWKFKITKYPPGEITLKSIKTWLPAVVPGTIHTDLLNADLIEDPFREGNEYRYEWIAKSNCI
ncbi:MAG TPA: hypothetical protein VLB50_10470, partial [Ignavibacteriaceae bacterium]|nr:hypothetical protein [Ignavibacteriaceae bacterium]